MKKISKFALLLAVVASLVFCTLLFTACGLTESTTGETPDGQEESIPETELVDYSGYLTFEMYGYNNGNSYTAELWYKDIPELKEAYDRFFMDKEETWENYWIFSQQAPKAKVVIPETYNGLPVTYADLNCYGVYDVTIPSSTEDIFIGINCVNAYHLDSNNPYLFVENGCVITKDEGWLIAGSARTKVIPSSAKGISPNAFTCCGEITTITIPAETEVIGYESFIGCFNLKTLYLKKGLKEIAMNAFDNCDGLTDVYFNGTKAEWAEVELDTRPDNNSLGGGDYVIHCSDGDIFDSSFDLEHVRKKGVLSVGVTDFSPFEYKEGNLWQGPEAELTRLFGEYLGVAIEFVEISWSDKRDLLDARKIDMIWNLLAWSEDRSDLYELSNPYLSGTLVFATNKNDVSDYSSEQALQNARVAVIEGTSAESFARENNYNYTAYSEERVVDAVRYHECDVMLAEYEFAYYEEGDAMTILPGVAFLDDDRRYVIGMRKGSNLSPIVNDFLEQCYIDGTISETYGSLLGSACMLYQE